MDDRMLPFTNLFKSAPAAASPVSTITRVPAPAPVAAPAQTRVIEPSLKEVFSQGIEFLRGEGGVWAGVGALALFLCANTFFLVYEQVSFYVQKSYSYPEAIFFSVLAEASVLVLSVASGITRGWVWKAVLRFLLVGSVCVVGMVIEAGVMKKGAVEEGRNQEIRLLQTSLEGLREREKQASEEIQGLDGEKFKSRRAKMTQDLDRGVRAEIREKEEKLGVLLSHGITGNSGDTEALMWMRYLALACNVVLGGLLAKMLRASKR